MWQEYATFHGIPIRVAMRQASFTDLLLWREYQEQKNVRELEMTQRQDYLFASVCQEIQMMADRLCRMLSGKKGARRIKPAKLSHKVIRFQLEKPPTPVVAMSPEDIVAAKKKAAMASKMAWGRALGLSPEVFK